MRGPEHGSNGPEHGSNPETVARAIDAAAAWAVHTATSWDDQDTRNVTFLQDAANWVKALPEDDARLEALGLLWVQGQHLADVRYGGERFGLFTGEGVRQALSRATSWATSFDVLLDELVTLEAEDLAVRDDL